ncbi:hypothetical protein OHC33_007545 [Knufia fluminis]|uniref:Het-C-domain-containing protein n=1 Tax=Knufia fluminis TaxID=191047 RepID=A0AAN8EBJ0_9EURO|nr:hypothetical protein OHC33_007545 [Knufia fluminis]
MAISATQFTLLCVVCIILLARPAQAFGAGNIGSTSKVEGENWRHGDLEDTLLTLMASRAMSGKKFSKLDVKRVYFGNWLRDYSQAVDVGTVKYVSAEAIRVVLWILGFMSFGYGTKEFEVTTERLGCYRPEEHIDNPKDYAENEDARQYDRRLRGPVDERTELAIDPVTGLKAYIASENLGIDTSAGLVRKLFGRSIELGRRYGRNKNKADLYEALRLLGTGCHCLEDFSAHSNYTELALIELGERDVFPHVGRNCQVRLRGARSAVYPIVTGTFGGVDFLHSVCGELDDKATQSEIQELEGTLQQAQNQGENTSVLQDLLKKIPDGVFGGKDEAGKADELKTNATQHQMGNTQISPREPEEWLQYVNDVQQQIYPIIEWHDEVMQGITETIEKIPILPDLIEQVQEQVNIFVFSLLAPFVLPIVSAIKNELNTGSNAIIQSSVEAQHIVFRDDDCSDPTHSMLSKDHFSNVLNEPAGKVAGQVLKWVVPQLIAAWDDDDIDIDRTLNRIIRGVFHHPALRNQGEDGAADGRNLMFSVVERWWEEKSEREKDSLRDQLSRDGVEESRNHKPGVKDHGHGSAKKLGMPNVYTSAHPGAPGGFGAPSGMSPDIANQATHQISQTVGEAVGGGVVGSLVGGLAGAVGTGVLSSLNNNDKDNDDDNTQSYNYGNNGRRTQNTSTYGGRPGSGNYGQSQHSRTEDRYGSQNEQYSGYNQSSSGGYSSESRRYESNTSSSYQTPSYQSSGFGGGRRNDDEERTSGYGQQSYGRGHDNDEPRSYGRRDQDDEPRSYGRRTDDEDTQRTTYGHQYNNENERSNYGESRREESGYGSSSAYGQQQESYGSSRNYGEGNRGDGYRSSGFGGGGRRGSNEEESYGSSGYSGRQGSGRRGGDEYESSGFGGGRRRGSNEQESYGSSGYSGRQGSERRGGDEYESSGYGNARRRGSNEQEMPGGFAEDEDNQRGYSRRRDDEDEGSYGGGRSGGYGY